MRFVCLNCKNFLSFKDLSYIFEDKAILIQGENNSDDDQESNGSGKSAIQSAIEYALFKTTSRKVNDVELINYDEDECVVALSIECQIRKEVLTIIRTIRRKGGSTLSITIGLEPANFATVNDGNKLIIEWIGISVEDLQNYYIINKERFRSIFSSSNREKVELIGRFNRSSLIKGVDKLVQDDVLVEEQKLTKLLEQNVSIESKIDVLNEQLTFELSRNFEEEKQAEIFSKEQQINKLKYRITINKDTIDSITVNDIGILTNEQLEISKKLDEIEETLKSYGEFDDSVVIDLQESRKLVSEQISNYVNDRKNSRSNLNDLDSTISEIERIIKGSVDCPKCGHKFNIGNPNIDIQEETEVLNKALKLQENINEKLNHINGLIFDLEYKNEDTNKKIQDIENKREEFYKRKKGIQRNMDLMASNFREIEKQIELKKSEIHRLNLDNETFENNIQHYLLDIEAIRTRENDTSRVDRLKNEIHEFSVELKKIEKKISDQKLVIHNTSQWVMNFKKFNLHLANLSLLAIQGNCNKFLKDIKSDIQVRWEGNKLLANGSLKEEITAYIIRDNQVRDFWSFSGGERARMEYAMIFTLQKMINSTNKWGGLSFTSMDEIMESIDAEGLSELMKSLDSLKKTILVTTHVVNRSISNNIIIVKKINKVSSINYGL